MRKRCWGTAVVFACLAMSVAANAADMPMRPPPPLVPLAFNWTGFYVGGHLGGAWAQRNMTDSLNGLNFNTGSSAAFVGGGQFGGNVQIGSEWDFDWAGSSNNPTGNGVVVPALGGNIVQVAANDQWMTTLAARFGYTIDRGLFYAKAGGSWVGNNTFTVTNVTAGASVTGTTNTVASGWLVGAGVEWALADGWTVKFEYDYLGLGNWSFTVPASSPFLAGDVFTNSNRNIQMLKVGFNYLFNGPAGRY